MVDRMLDDDIRRVLSDIDATICEEVTILPRDERLAQVPREILDGPAAPIIRSTRDDGQLWTHQAEALDRLLAGKNVVVSTSTASGKSLIFQTHAFHRILTEPDAKVVVFYPTRALAADQYERWKAQANTLGLPTSLIGQIDGGVEMSERMGILRQARVLILTPDICQAWLMRSIGQEDIRRFVGALSLIVIDEAHNYESVFGSNSAFLFRRLRVAKRRIAAQNGMPNSVQIVAATATILNAEEHMSALTGVAFDEVTAKADGSPQHPISLLHVEAPDRHADVEGFASTVLAALLDLPDSPTFIAFLDSRMGVERVAKDLPDDVLSYRAGYESTDRKGIESRLRRGTLQGVVSTSALELGIDIANLHVGVTARLPHSRKSLLQRIGRVGRAAPGVFLLLAPRDALTQYGHTLHEYYAGAVEPSHLYLGNRFIQFAHARCLFEELEALGLETSRLPGGVAWPEDFESVYRQSRTGFSEEFDRVAQLGGDAPHFNYSLRQVGESRVEISTGTGGFVSPVGDMTHSQALREAYPGATYYHRGQTYRVVRWESFDALTIRVRGIKVLPATAPIIRKTVTVDVRPSGIINGRALQGAKGFIAEAAIQVFESVEGFEKQGQQLLYRDLQANDPNMRRKHRQFRTTGVVIHIDEPWFHNSTVKTRVATALKNAFALNFSIAPQDIDSVGTRIGSVSGSGPQPAENTIVIYDAVYGGIRLTEALYDSFPDFMEKLHRGSTDDPGPEQVGKELAEKLLEWGGGLPQRATGSTGLTEPVVDVPDGSYLVYAPGSIVSVPQSGSYSERKLIRPLLAEIDPGVPEVFYVYEQPNAAVTARIPATAVEPGDEYNYVFWNPETGEFREIES